MRSKLKNAGKFRNYKSFLAALYAENSRKNQIFLIKTNQMLPILCINVISHEYQFKFKLNKISITQH